MHLAMAALAAPDRVVEGQTARRPAAPLTLVVRAARAVPALLTAERRAVVPLDRAAVVERGEAELRGTSVARRELRDRWAPLPCRVAPSELGALG